MTVRKYNSSASKMTVDLPTARDYLKSSVRLTIWCKACGHQIEMEFGELSKRQGRCAGR